MKPRIQQIEGIPTPTEADVGKSLNYKGANAFEWIKANDSTPATPAQPGTIQLATVAEVLAGLNDVKAVTAATLKAHSDQEKLERNQAILAALQGAIDPNGQGVTPQYVQQLLSAEGAARTQAIAAAIGGEVTARDLAIALSLAAAKAYTDSKIGSGGTGGGGGTPTDPGTGTPGGTVVPERAIRDRSGSPLIGRDGQYILWRVPVTTPVDPGDGTPPVIVVPEGAYVDRNGSPIKMRDGTYLMQRTAPDVVIPTDPNPDPEPVVVFPSTPHLRLTSLHSNVIIEKQDGVNATVRLVRPLYRDNGILSIKEYNSTGEGEFFNTYKGPNNLLSKYNGISAVSYTIESDIDGTFTTQYLKSIGNGQFAELNVDFIISGQRTGPIPSPTTPLGKDAVIFFDDFLPGTGTGALINTYGNIKNTEQGTVLLVGRASAMTPPRSDGRLVGGEGYPNGLYEFRVKMIGDLGNAGGPCILLWPHSNNWPGPEVDMGEFFADGSMYMANHYKDASYPVEGNQQDRKTIWPIKNIPGGFNPYVYNTYGARLMNTGVIFYMNGTEFARDEFSPAPKDYKNGGEDHTIGLLSGSDHSSDGTSPTGLECDWIRFTPEALIGVDPGTTPVPPTDPINPTQPNAKINSVTPASTAPVAPGTLVNFTIETVGFTNIGYVKVSGEAAGYKWLTDPIYKATTGSLVVSVPINNNDEFVKAIPPDGYDLGAYAKDSLRMSVTTGTTPVTPSNVFYEDFSSNTKGQMEQIWGDSGKVSFANGEMKLAGSSAGVGVQMLCAGPTTCFGNGYFEIRAKMTGGKGSGSGPALVLWPADNIWPGSEIDIGEVNSSNQTYYATHWRAANGDDAASYIVLPNGHDYTVYHTYAALLQTNIITYYLDGVKVGEETAHPAPDAAHGGVNHSIGVMNRSAETTLTVDWMRWTPEANILNGTGPIPAPTTTTPTPLPGNTINILVRGQSNALLFVDRGGVWKLRDLLQASTGKTIKIFAEFGTDTNTINSGTAFMDWERDGQQASFLRYINTKMTAADKANPTITLWMHNEYEQNNWQLVQSEYEARIRSDAVKIRAALGQPASKTPYLFASIRYNYGNAFGVVNGAWIALKNDPSFNAYITYETSADDILMDGDGYAGSSHMGNEDTIRAANKLAPVLKNIINAQ